MAFGFGFNKQKVLSAAEKFVQQGKLQNAIAEYEKVLKADPKDLTVNNTVGDLYARLGETTKAVECFKSVGDAYAAQGFTVKGIAMYKKITKLHPSVDGSLKLAELYTQQGLFNDARAQYLQVAEDFMKNGELDQAVRLFQKVLEMDPENVPMRVKLAEVYIRLGKKKEAWEIFSAAAEALRSRGSLPAAEDILQRMLSLDPGNSYALLLRGRAALESDDPKKAIQYLEKAADLDSHPEGLRDLLKAYLQTGRMAQAGPIADKLLSVHNDPDGLFLVAEGYTQAGQYPQALEVYSHNADRLMAADSSKLMSSLHTMIGHVRDDAPSLDNLLLLLNKAGESTHVGEVTELLAHASVKNGNLTRARDLYQMLATMEPQNTMHMQGYHQVLARMEEDSPTRLITADEGAVIVEELEATAPIVDQSYPDEVAVAVRSALTDADLFLSYNLPDKAIVPLLGALPQAPRDVRLNQRLAALHTRSHRFTEAAVCCRNLESMYSEAGYPDEALRYGELATRYEERAGAAPIPVAPAPSTARPTTPWPAAAMETPAHEMSVSAVPEPVVSEHVIEVEQVVEAQPEFELETFHPSPAQTHDAPVHEATTHDAEDLSDEWNDSSSVEATAPPAHEAAEEPAAVELDPDSPEIPETVEEVRFYLEHYMSEQARAAFSKLETLTKDPSILDPLRAQIESCGTEPPAEAEPEIAENFVDAAPDFEVEVAHDASAVVDHHAAHQEPEEKEVPKVSRKAAKKVHEEVKEEKQPEPAHAAADSGELASLEADLESSLGDAFPEPSSPEPLPAWPAAKPAAQKPVAPKAAPEPTPAKKTVRPKPEPEFEPAVAHTSIGAGHLPVEPVAPAMPSMAASSSGAAAGTAPALSYGPAAVRPLGAGAQAMMPQAGVDLSEMFGELKQELEEEIAAGDDDPETHYNLGVAFREMGLLDEAIAELQKVCNAVDRGHPFSQLVQAYTWLAQCFLDKGVPDAAIRWYEKALTIPGLDAESRLAIHYELGSASESAHNKDAALRYFTQVYGANIDYRDVADRIQALKS
jgi:tetratricopeptide (TPR) repeat protein